jgi:hypothetical protein
MRILAVLAALAALAIAAPAHADWQWTRWGMTPEQVIAASDGKAVYNAKGMLTLSQPMTVQSCSFQVYFEFDESKTLAAVALDSDADCYSDLVVALTSIYGPPVSFDDNSRIFGDLTKGNRISIIGIYGGTTIKYRPLPNNL